MTNKHDDMLARIEAFNDASGGGVVIQKAAKGYSLFRQDTGRPVTHDRPCVLESEGASLSVGNGLMLWQDSTSGQIVQKRGIGCSV